MGRKPTTSSNKVSKKKNKSQSLGILSKSRLKLKSSTPQIPLPIPKDWNNSTILTKIFDQMDFKDTINANSVCRQWHQLTNPKIYRSLNLLRYRHAQNEYHLGEKNPKKLRNLEVMSCIENNAKHSELVNHLKLNFIIDPTTSKHLFSTFCHLSHLEFKNLTISQDLFLSCLKPLKNLVSLIIDMVRVKEIFRKRLEFDIVQLPTTLKTLKFNLASYQSPNLFKESMMTHTNLEELVYSGNRESDMLSPFLTNYPTLKRLALKQGYDDHFNNKVQEIIRSNPQLTELTYHSHSIDSNIIKLINTNLPNLQTLKYLDFTYTQPDTLTNIQFPKKMNLTSFTLHSNQLSIESYISIIKNTPYIKNLKITIENNYKRITQIIHQKLSNLEHLTYINYRPNSNIIDKELETSFIKHEINDTYYSFAKSLKSLNFGNFDILSLDPSCLERFSNLEVVQFMYHVEYNQISESKQLLQDYLKAFTGWKFRIFESYCDLGGYLYKSNQAKPKGPNLKPFLFHRVQDI